MAVQIGPREDQRAENDKIAQTIFDEPRAQFERERV
jgi:hypothetical protein